MKHLFTFLLSMSWLCSLAQPSTLRINEVMSSNGSTVLSGYGLYSDWIELYNSGGQIVDIGGMYMTDDPLNLMKYRFPFGQSLEIVPGGFSLIWADDSANTDHTNFKLSSMGETILLVDTNGVDIIDSVSFPALSADQSYGRSTDGSGNFQLFAVGSATPSASNGILSSGFWIHPQQLSIFPNPAKDVIFMKGPFGLNKISRVEIFSTSGNCVVSLDKPDSLQNGIGIEHLSPGFYLVRISSSESSVVMPLLRQ